MEELYHNLTPEETVVASDLILDISKRIYGNNYVDDLSIRIEREKSILNKSIALAHESEFSRLLTVVDSEFYRSLLHFTDLVRVKEKIDSIPEEYHASQDIYDVVRELVEDWDILSRDEMMSRVAELIFRLDVREMVDKLKKAGVMPLFNDLKSKYYVLSGLVRDRDELFDDVPPPSVAGRRLAATLRDLHFHVYSYSRLGNREYRVLLHELEEHLVEKGVHAS